MKRLLTLAPLLTAALAAGVLAPAPVALAAPRAGVPDAPAVVDDQGGPRTVTNVKLLDGRVLRHR